MKKMHVHFLFLAFALGIVSTISAAKKEKKNHKKNEHHKGHHEGHDSERSKLWHEKREIEHKLHDAMGKKHEAMMSHLKEHHEAEQKEKAAHVQLINEMINHINKLDKAASAKRMFGKTSAPAPITPLVIPATPTPAVFKEDESLKPLISRLAEINKAVKEKEERAQDMKKKHAEKKAMHNKNAKHDDVKTDVKEKRHKKAQTAGKKNHAKKRTKKAKKAKKAAASDVSHAA